MDGSGGRLVTWLQPFGHEVALVIDEAAAAVEFDGAISVVNFEVKGFCIVFPRGGFREVQELGANSLPPVGRLDEELIDPGTFAAVFQAVVEADDQVAEGSSFLACDVDEAAGGVVEEFREISSNDRFVERFGPGVVDLHVAHQDEQHFEVGGSGAFDSDGHGRSSSLQNGDRLSSRPTFEG